MGLLRYRKQLQAAPRVIGPETGLRGGNTFRVFEDSRGGIWASTFAISNNGLYRWDTRTGRFEGFDDSHGLPSLHHNANLPAAFAEDRGGQIWIGMLDGGLARFRKGNFQQFPSSSGAPDQGVRSLLVDRQGRLWIGSRRRGLLRVDDPSAAAPVFSGYTKSSGLSSNTILALAEDLAGRIYAASGSGIDRLDPATGRVRRFTTADGLLSGEFRVALRDRHGALWFGGDPGLLRIEPREDRIGPPNVLVYSIRVNGEKRPISDLGETEPAALSLSSSQRQLQVDFGAFRHDLLYQTLLTGVDRDWTPPSSSRSVHFLSVAPGKYELSIRAVTPEGTSSARPARVRFRIAAPVWQRWWFLFLSAAALAGMVYAAHRYRVAQAVALERVRTRIASDLHDDIGSSLSRIAILSEVTQRRVGPTAPGAAEPLSEIADASRELVDSMSDIVWAIDPEQDQLSDLVHRMRRFAGDLLTPRNIDFRFHAPDEDSNLQMPADLRRQIYLIFKESLNNLVRHSGCAQAEIDIHREKDWLVLRMTDNGKGFDLSQSRNGHGLKSMAERARNLGGEICVTSHPDQGTTVTLRAPWRKITT